MTQMEVIDMNVVYLLLFIAAAVCFVLAAANFAMSTRRGGVNLVAVGLFFWVLVPLIQSIRHLN